jgi:hypothetical protein
MDNPVDSTGLLRILTEADSWTGCLAALNDARLAFALPAVDDAASVDARVTAKHTTTPRQGDRPCNATTGQSSR